MEKMNLNFLEWIAGGTNRESSRTFGALSYLARFLQQVWTLESALLKYCALQWVLSMFIRDRQPKFQSKILIALCAVMWACVSCLVACMWSLGMASNEITGFPVLGSFPVDHVLWTENWRDHQAHDKALQLKTITFHNVLPLLNLMKNSRNSIRMFAICSVENQWNSQGFPSRSFLESVRKGEHIGEKRKETILFWRTDQNSSPTTDDLCTVDRSSIKTGFKLTFSSLEVFRFGAGLRDKRGFSLISNL